MSGSSGHFAGKKGNCSICVPGWPFWEETVRARHVATIRIANSRNGARIIAEVEADFERWIAETIVSSRPRTADERS